MNLLGLLNRNRGYSKASPSLKSPPQHGNDSEKKKKSYHARSSQGGADWPEGNPHSSESVAFLGLVKSLTVLNCVSLVSVGSRGLPSTLQEGALQILNITPRELHAVKVARLTSHWVQSSSQCALGTWKSLCRGLGTWPGVSTRWHLIQCSYGPH